MQLSEQEIVRRESLQKLRNLGINPYPQAEFKTTSTVKEIVKGFDNLEGKEVILAGRIMSRRIMGKASFAELKDATGRIKNYCGITTSINPDQFKITLSKYIKENMAIYLIY